MTEFDNNFSVNLPFVSKSKNKEQQNKPPVQEKDDKQQQVDQLKQVRNTPQQSLANTNSNIPVNQPVNTSPVLTQAALNTADVAKTPANAQQKDTASSNNIQPTPVQGDFTGPSDLPAYAGIANMSLKSWVANNTKNESERGNISKDDATTLLDAIKGFERKNYEGEEGKDGLADQNKSLKALQKKLLLLSHIFAPEEQSASSETKLVSSVLNFNKLGKQSISESPDEQGFYNLKSSPPVPAEEVNYKSEVNIKIKQLYELFALPKEFPECLRLFADENIEINSKYLNSFFVQRLKFVQEKVFSDEKSVKEAFSTFVSLLHSQDMLIPLILLYYPLPFPGIKQEKDLSEEWSNKNKLDKKPEPEIVASCEIYYVHKVRGRFLIKIFLDNQKKITLDIQTAKKNNGIVHDIETSVSEGMYLLENPPKLSDLNIMLCDEIYKATDYDEQLAIHSSGPLRLEIIIVTYSVLVVLNKLNEEIDPSGLIEMLD